ncbi:MAG: chorismate synthase, partial [Deltaproteobacteria bacterium]|nr:chorismate synthase [Deltaproteobacteria bacterium]
MGSLLGRHFSVMTFGESHGPGLGVVIDGLPAGLAISLEELQRDLDKRRPGQSGFTSPRKESDQVEILSGLTGEGLTNGSPLAMLVRNQDARGSDYAKTAEVFRPGHADWTYFKKYDLLPQPGGGRASGRETVGRVAAGAVARQLLKPLGVTVRSGTVAVGAVWGEKIDWEFAQANPLRFLDPNGYKRASEALLEAKTQGDSLGSVVAVSALGVPVGWGDPVFDKLEA